MKNLYDIKFTFIINMKNVTIYHRIVFNMFIFLISFFKHKPEEPLNFTERLEFKTLFLQPSMLASSF